MFGDKLIHAGKGFIPVMLTPFDDKGTIDYGMLAGITEFYCESGAVGLFANCLSSEMFELTPEERLSTTRHVVEIANGRMPVVATGNFGDSASVQADFVKEIYDTGVDAVILATSLLAGPDDDEDTFFRNARQLMDLTGDIPLGFYECPLPYKRTLSAGVLKRLLESGRIVYHKDTSLDIEQVRAKIAAADGYDFRLYDAYLVHAVESLKAGADGLSCIQGNFFPEIVVWVCENFDRQPLDDKVDKVQQFLIEKMDVMHTEYPAVAKYFLQKRGFPISLFCRAAVPPLTRSVVEGIDRLFDEYTQLRQELGF